MLLVLIKELRYTPCRTAEFYFYAKDGTEIPLFNLCLN